MLYPVWSFDPVGLAISGSLSIYLLYLFTIALFTVNTAHLQYNEIKHVCEAVLGYFVVLAQNCLASTLEYIVMQMRKTNREKGYYLHIVQKMNKKNNVGS